MKPSFTSATAAAWTLLALAALLPWSRAAVGSAACEESLSTTSAAALFQDKDAKGKGKDEKGKKDPKGTGALKHLTVKVGKLNREALLHVPKAAGNSAMPVVFVFHGHGNTMRKAADSFDIHEHWGDALAVYPQGVPTPTKSDPKGERAGWQNRAGTLGDRDLHFFDTLLAQLKKSYPVDSKRIYATGHSNGGGFTFVLWAARGELLDAVAVCAPRVEVNMKGLKPRPCLYIAGRKDDHIEFKQQQQWMRAVREQNGCEKKGQAWTKDGPLDCTLYPAKTGAEFVSAIHDGGHGVPGAAGKLIVRFFKENKKK